MSAKFKMIAASAALCLVLGGVASAQPRAERPDGPELSIRSERAAHPNIVKAINALNAAYRDLEAAPHDFGGNKAKAMSDVRASIHSLKKALYYRLKMDDAAIDRAQ